MSLTQRKWEGNIMEPDKSYHGLKILGPESENAGSLDIFAELTSKSEQGKGLSGMILL